MSDVDRALDLATSTVRDVANARAEIITTQTRRLLEEFAGRGISGGPVPGAISQVGLDEIDARSKATIEAVKRGATTVGLHYSRTLTAELQAGFNGLFADQARIVESQTAHAVKTLPYANAGAVESNAVGAIRQRVMRANTAAATEIEHFVESLRTSQREQREKFVGRALWGTIGAVGGIALTKAVDWIPTWFHH